MPCARAATRCGAFPSLFFAPRTVLPSIAITRRPPARTALVHSQAPRTRSSTSALTKANARRNVDSSAGPRTAPSTARTSGPASAAHCPIAANDRDPAITAAIPMASSPASACRRPRLFRGSGTWARRSSRYWLRAAGIGEDVIGGRASLVADDGERKELPSFRPGPARHPQTRQAPQPLLRHRRSQPHITTLPCPCSVRAADNGGEQVRLPKEQRTVLPPGWPAPPPARARCGARPRSRSTSLSAIALANSRAPLRQSIESARIFLARMIIGNEALDSGARARWSCRCQSAPAPL